MVVFLLLGASAMLPLPTFALRPTLLLPLGLMPTRTVDRQVLWPSSGRKTSLREGRLLHQRTQQPESTQRELAQQRAR
jgi:hypothetical protein